MKSKVVLNIGQIVCDGGTFKDCKIEVKTDISVEDAIQSAKTLPELIKNIAQALPAIKEIITLVKSEMNDEGGEQK